MSRSWTAQLEERLLVPSYASPWAPVSIAAHRSLAFPFQLTGGGRRRTISGDAGTYEILELGREKLTAPVCAGLFGPLPPANQDPRRWFLTSAHLKTAADLVIAEVHRWMAPRFRREGWLIVPRSVRWHGDLTSVPPAAPSKSLQSNLAKLRKHNFTLVQGTSPDNWLEFFTTMVAPQARTRHGSSAWLASESFRLQLSKRGTLHFVLEAGARVAGACSIAHADTLWLPMMGVRHGDPELFRRGAGVAAFALPIEWARTNGYRTIDLGRTGPFVNEGLQAYKRRWGLFPVPDPMSLVTAVWIGSAQARQAFSREPVLVETESGLEVFADGIV